MDYKLYGSSDVLLLNENSSNSKDTWNFPSDCSTNSMEQNDESEYFGWNPLKIDEEDDENGKMMRKRKMASPSCHQHGGVVDEKKSKLSNNINGAFKIVDKDPLSMHDNGKGGLVKKTTTSSKGSGSNRMPQWQVEDYGDLNSDIDSSLSLSTELVNTSYNVNESMLSLNGMTVFKQEAPSPTLNEMTHLQVSRQHNSHRQSPTSTQQHGGGGGVVISAVNSTMDDNNSQSMFNSTINQLLNQTALVNLHNVIDSNNISSNTQDHYGVSSTNYTPMEDCRFQYVLAAATSIATKQNEDTLTYLNQGQSYEIKLKKLGDLTMYRGKLLKSVVRICFHERRLQYMEKEQMTSWQKARPGDRILEVDVPLSYGAFDVVQPTSALNVVHFTWDPTKEVGIYIKVNCISTEFTPKKHGGEKGVPFRIQVETYQHGDSLEKRLHAAACQIKVFKLKGADRKHKQDREKIMKRPLSEQEKYQPSYDVTVLNDIPEDAILTSPPVAPVSPFAMTKSNPQSHQNQLTPRFDNNNSGGGCCPNQLVLSPKMSPVKSVTPERREEEPVNTTVSQFNGSPSSSLVQLTPDSTPEETHGWLLANRFEKYLQTFAQFSGLDMLRLSRHDLTQICEHADGIRLHNALHARPPSPKLRLYISLENSSVFSAIFLRSYNRLELLHKLTTVAGVQQDPIREVYVEGPQSRHVQLNNELLQEIEDESMFTMQLVQENGQLVVILKRK